MNGGESGTNTEGSTPNMLFHPLRNFLWEIYPRKSIMYIPMFDAGKFISYISYS